MYIRSLKFNNDHTMEYNFREVEKQWQAYWAKNKTYKTENNSESHQIKHYEKMKEF